MDIDKQFILTVPSYEHVEDHVIYMFRLEDTIKNKVYVSGFRFKDLQQFYRRLSQKKYDMPDFPKTHFWKKTNKDPKLIEERRAQLELFFNTVINDPLIRGHKQTKDFVKACKKDVTRDQRCRSQGRYFSPSVTDSKRAKSLQKSNRMLELPIGKQTFKLLN